MEKRGKVFKGIFGFMVLMFLIVGMSGAAYAEEVTKRADDIPQALALIQELQTNGITYDLTIESVDQNIINYLKAELRRIPLATIYRPVQFKLIGQSNGTCGNNDSTANRPNNPSCGNNGSTDNGQNNPSCGNNGSTDNRPNNPANGNNTQNNNCNNANNTVQDSEDVIEAVVDNSTQCETNATVDNEDTSKEETKQECTNNDNSPKTGDNSSLVGVAVVLVISIVAMGIVLIVRKRRA